nr:unnamed protein product [Mus musculus]
MGLQRGGLQLPRQAVGHCLAGRHDSRMTQLRAGMPLIRAGACQPDLRGYTLWPTAETIVSTAQQREGEKAVGLGKLWPGNRETYAYIMQFCLSQASDSAYLTCSFHFANRGTEGYPSPLLLGNTGTFGRIWVLVF